MIQDVISILLFIIDVILTRIGMRRDTFGYSSYRECIVGSVGTYRGQTRLSCLYKHDARAAPLHVDFRYM